MGLNKDIFELAQDALSRLDKVRLNTIHLELLESLDALSESLDNDLFYFGGKKDVPIDDLHNYNYQDDENEMPYLNGIDRSEFFDE